MANNEKKQKIEDITIIIKEEYTEDSGGPVKIIELSRNDKNVGKIVMKDGKLVESSISKDIQDSGLYEKIAKKFGIEKINTTPSNVANQMGEDKREPFGGKIESVKMMKKAKQKMLVFKQLLKKTKGFDKREEVVIDYSSGDPVVKINGKVKQVSTPRPKMQKWQEKFLKQQEERRQQQILAAKLRSNKKSAESYIDSSDVGGKKMYKNDDETDKVCLNGKKVEQLSKPPVSEAQRRAMYAAAAGRSTIGIPKEVGEKFVAEDKGGKLPERKKKLKKCKIADLFAAVKMKKSNGLASGKTAADFTPVENLAILRGAGIEAKEHGAQHGSKTAMDHVVEHGAKYYTNDGLIGMEKKLEKMKKMCEIVKKCVLQKALKTAKYRLEEFSPHEAPAFDENHGCDEHTCLEFSRRHDAMANRYIAESYEDGADKESKRKSAAYHRLHAQKWFDAAMQGQKMLGGGPIKAAAKLRSSSKIKKNIGMMPPAIPSVPAAPIAPPAIPALQMSQDLDEKEKEKKEERKINRRWIINRVDKPERNPGIYKYLSDAELTATRKALSRKGVYEIRQIPYKVGEKAHRILDGTSGEIVYVDEPLRIILREGDV